MDSEEPEADMDTIFAIISTRPVYESLTAAVLAVDLDGPLRKRKDLTLFGK